MSSKNNDFKHKHFFEFNISSENSCDYYFVSVSPIGPRKIHHLNRFALLGSHIFFTRSEKVSLPLIRLNVNRCLRKKLYTYNTKKELFRSSCAFSVVFFFTPYLIYNVSRQNSCIVVSKYLIIPFFQAHKYVLVRQKSCFQFFQKIVDHRVLRLLRKLVFGP